MELRWAKNQRLWEVEPSNERIRGGEKNLSPLCGWNYENPPSLYCMKALSEIKKL